MGDGFGREVKIGVYLTLSTVTTAAPLSLMLGYGWVGFAKLWVILGMNVFGLPLILTDAFIFPLWVWYVIVVVWIGKAAIAIKYAP